MRQVITSMMVYDFNELPEKTQKIAVDKFVNELRQNGEDFNHEFCYDTFEEMARILGIELSLDKRPGRDKLNVYYSLGYSQGDGASFGGTYSYNPDTLKELEATYPRDSKSWKEIYQIAETLNDVQATMGNNLTAHIRVSHGHYVHSHMMQVSVFHSDNKDVPVDVSNVVTETLRALADWFYNHLRDEHTYQTSFEYIKDLFEANEYEFDEDGNLT